jgi:uncharacterized membrane protein AbrB (regulator of aidB expression)
MSQVFSTRDGSLGQAVGPAIVLFVIFLGVIIGVIIYHAVMHRTRDLDKAPGITGQAAGGARPGRGLSADIRTTQTVG